MYGYYKENLHVTWEWEGYVISLRMFLFYIHNGVLENNPSTERTMQDKYFKNSFVRKIIKRAWCTVDNFL